MSEVQAVTEQDLNVILGWLQREHEEDGEGFWCNRNMITRSLRENGNFLVIREDGEAVAFQVRQHDSMTGILCVRKDRQRQGYGTALASFSVTRAYKNNVNVLYRECTPSSSLPFWEKMGFERYGDSSPPITVRRVLHRKNDIPTNLPTVEVTVGFYPEEAAYKLDVSPFKVHQLTGGRLENMRVKLPCRVIGLNDDAHPYDLVVKIEIHGDKLCFCKAKYDDAKAVGVQRGVESASYYIDEIVTAKKGT